MGHIPFLPNCKTCSYMFSIPSSEIVFTDWIHPKGVCIKVESVVVTFTIHVSSKEIRTGFFFFFTVKMVNYKVTVSTSGLLNGTTMNIIFIKLVGTDGESDRTWLCNFTGPLAFTAGQASSFNVSCRVSIGKLILIELDKQGLPLIPQDSWFPAKVEVESPEGDTYNFPIYRWIIDSEVERFREGTALRVFEDSHHLGKYSREQALKQREKDYRWDVYAEGIPHNMKVEGPLSLPCEVRFSFTKSTEFGFTALTGLSELGLKGLSDSKKSWANLDDLNRVFCNKRTDISEYVQEHWKEDTFFGYQYLNGINPMLIRRCTALPENFPVTDDMLFPDGQSRLADEMKNGNIFLLDYKRLDGLKANMINEKQQYLMAPLVLLQKTPDDKLM
ncbi:arachidonate 12-lipoxygenase, 12R-type-like, partial [Notothenia coriiceps]|uniref:Arachidonate 12-lipoxygenase, 12R-type-like n=1 Tax=Notothenia coriiceps TaxID=8208 RepID=A0A6I9N2X1_9TELE